jgi:hypothetical protein
MYDHSHQFEQVSRAITTRTRRFFSSSSSTGTLLFRKSATGKPRRIRFGIVIPVLCLSLYVLYLINSFLYGLFFGSSSRNNVSDRRLAAAGHGPVKPPTWLDRGDITDLEMRPVEGTNMTTAILLSWERLESLKEIVVHLCPHIMFKEIMIWNNKVDVHLEEKVRRETDKQTKNRRE